MSIKELEMSVEELAAEERYTYAELDKFEDIPKFLKDSGLLDNDGIFLTDIDETMRPSLGDKLKPENYMNLKAARLDEVPDTSLNVLDFILEHNWKCAAVTNQPREGHQISKFLAEKLGYKTISEELEKRGIPIFGFMKKKNIISDSFRFFHGIATIECINQLLIPPLKLPNG